MDNALANLSVTEKRELLARLLKEKAGGGTQQPPSEFPLSASQQGLWYAFRRDPDVTAYNVFLPSRFRSPIDLEAMKRSAEQLVRRHCALRTVFAESESTNEPVQRIQASMPPEFRIVETPDVTESELTEQVLAETQRPFDLTRGPLLRIVAFRISEQDVVLVATTHHIVVDFWSLVLIMDEVRELYPALVAGTEHSLPPAPSNYDRFVGWQSDLIADDRGKQIAAYWKAQLADVSPIIEWATDFQRPPKFTHRASVTPVRFSKNMGVKVNALARKLNVTGNVVVMALLQVLVGRFTGQDSFSVGSPFSGRSQHEFEKTVGFFVNMLPITADLSANPSFEDLVRSVGRKMVDALANEALPFSEIVSANARSRDSSRHPLFQVSCTFEKSHLKNEQGRGGFLFGDGQAFDDFAGMRQESFRVEHPTCHYDIEFVFEFLHDEIHGMICYCRDLFAPDTIESMGQQLVALADRFVDDPHRSIKDLALAVEASSSPASQSGDPRETIQDLLVDSQQEIVRAARRFAPRLARLGVTPGSVVPVCLTQGGDAWVAILGVMMAGAVPVPIDANQPAVSPHVLREDAAIEFVVASRGEGWAKELAVTTVSVEQTLVEDDASIHAPAPEDLAYVIYTSGSTGKPKGVMVQHQAIANTLRWRERATPMTGEDRVLILLSHQFDAAMAIVVTTLQQNATPIWPRHGSPAQRSSEGGGDLDLDRLIDQIIGDRITILPAVPSLLRALVSHPKFSLCTSIRQIWSGGESMPSDLPALIRSRLDCTFWNFYGPTEASVEATAIEVTEIEPPRKIPIGREIDGTRIDLVDNRLAPLPVGVPGQLVISGRGLAVGYLNRPELTRKVFVWSDQILDSDGAPTRIYLTGDRGRRRGDGTIEFLGRMDHQVKLRGYRVELEEVERVIQLHRHVKRAAVNVIDPGTAGERLAAFVTATADFQLESLHRHLSANLPPFKRPASITLLDRLPIGTSGKVQRDRLPMPSDQATITDRVTEPRCELERHLESCFAKMLDQDLVGIDANFFEAGGTSLQAAMLTSELSGQLGIEVPTSLLFDLGDVRSIGCRLVQLHESTIRDQFGDESIHIAKQSLSNAPVDSLLAELKPTGTRPPIFMIHPPGGIVVCYRELASHLSSAQPLVAVRSRGLHGDERLPKTLGEMAAEYVCSIQSRHPQGPYWIGGWSLGGVIAFEVARQLIENGADVAGLVLLDSTVPERSDPNGESAGMEYGIEMSLAQLSELSSEEQLPLLFQHAQRLGVLDDETPAVVIEKVIEDLRRLFAHHVELCQNYELQKLDVPVLLIRPRNVPGRADARPDRGWSDWTRNVEVCSVSGHHHSMVQMPGASQIAEQIDQFLQRPSS